MKNLSFFLILVLCLIGTSIFAAAQFDNAYYYAGVFSDAAYYPFSKTSEAHIANKKILENAGWKLNFVAHQVSFNQVKSEILNTQAKKDELKEFNKDYNKIIDNNKELKALREYANEQQQLNATENIGVKNENSVNEYPPEQTYGYVTGEKVINGVNQYVIAFTGTVNTPMLYSWLFTDFMIFPVEFENTGTHVHAGFDWNLNACKKTKPINDLLNKFYNDGNSHLIITGHSLGAGVAILEAASIINKNPALADRISVYTFAEPCPGKKDFVEHFKKYFKDYKWFVNLGDIVPEAPMPFGFEHFDYLNGLQLFNKGDVKITDWKNIKQWFSYLGNKHDTKYYIEAAKELNYNI